MKQVAIYIKDTETLEYNRIDLFADEKISINSSIQNINDISKTYTDFSQTFTVPGSVNNNRIFKHWYENSNDEGFSTLNKSDAYIEVDTIRFRTGKIQLESANVQDGDIKNYGITFIGSLGNLKDKFAGLSLKDLHLEDILAFTYTANNVKNAVVGTTQSSIIMFPLISSNNYWTYGSGTYNIASAAKPIYYDELFPAVSLEAMFVALESVFNINFIGTFLATKKFVNAFLWLKNADKFEFKTSQSPDFNSLEANGNPLATINLATDEITLKWTTVGGIGYLVAGTLYFSMQIQFATAGVPYNIIIYKDGKVLTTVAQTSTTTSQTYLIYSISATSTNRGFEGVYTFRVESNQAITFSNTAVYCMYKATFREDRVIVLTYQDIYRQTGGVTLSSELNLNNYLPDMKIEEFFTGILKMFNLTCYSNDSVNYYVEQLETYYATGAIVDITEYTKSDAVALNRVTNYSKVTFEYQKSESIVNSGFLSANNIDYGTFKYDTGYDGGEYTIKLPFENLNFTEFTGTTLQVGLSLKSDLQKYTPKPVILYDYNSTALTPVGGTFYFATTPISGSASGVAYTSYKAFGQETLIQNGLSETFSLNFPSQQSTLTNEVIDNGLYNQYYSTYLGNIFNKKARLVKVTSILPTSVLTTIKLNDRIILKDKRYIINTMTTDITSGETQFELLTDIRPAPIGPVISTTTTTTTSTTTVAPLTPSGTTTTTAGPTTTTIAPTTTTTVVPTTTSTTTVVTGCRTYFIDNNNAYVCSFNYTDCDGVTTITRSINRGANTTLCAMAGTIVVTTGPLSITDQGSCGPTTTTAAPTTTTAAPTTTTAAPTTAAPTTAAPTTAAPTTTTAAPTTAAPTTAAPTTAAPVCRTYVFGPAYSQTVIQWTNCNGSAGSQSVASGGYYTIPCMREGSGSGIGGFTPGALC